VPKIERLDLLPFVRLKTALKRSWRFQRNPPSNPNSIHEKKFTLQSAFFKLRILIGLFIVLAGVFLALVGFGAFSAQAQQKPFLAAAIAALGAFDSSRATNQSGSPNQGAMMEKIAPWVMEHTANGQQAEFLVVLADQADLSGAAALPTKNEKGRYVRDALWNKSQTTQGPLLQWLRERGLEHRSFYIINAILVKGSREIAEALAARPDVARVEGNPQIQNSLPQPGPTAEAPSQLGAPGTIELGINYTHAPQVWALGFIGEYIVVASADTGFRWSHNAI
jgi:hypothetical protein